MRVTNREEGFDRDSLKCRITTVRLEQRLPRWQPNPQDSPSSNRKHLFRSDNSAECLWGPSLGDIKRIRKDDVGRKTDAEKERERDGEAVLRQTERATEDALTRRNDSSSGGEATADAIASPKMRRRGVQQQMQQAPFDLIKFWTIGLWRVSPLPWPWQDWLNSFTDKPTVWNAIIH